MDVVVLLWLLHGQLRAASGLTCQFTIRHIHTRTHRPWSYALQPLVQFEPSFVGDYMPIHRARQKSSPPTTSCW